MGKKFLRSSTKYYKRLNRRKKRKWRRARGRHSKIREKRKGRLAKVEVGFRTDKEERGRIEGKITRLVRNLKEAGNTEKGEFIIIGKIGRKKRLDIEKKIEERGGQILNPKKILK